MVQVAHGEYCPAFNRLDTVQSSEPRRQQDVQLYLSSTRGAAGIAYKTSRIRNRIMKLEDLQLVSRASCVLNLSRY